MATKPKLKPVANKSSKNSASVLLVRPPKKRPRGSTSGIEKWKFDNTPEGRARSLAARANRRTLSGGSAKISVAYTAVLSQPVPQDFLDKFGLQAKDAKGITWADLIAFQTVCRAVGIVDPDKIGFTAITELRETTEGKTPDQSRIGDPQDRPLERPIIAVQFVKPKSQEAPPAPDADTEMEMERANDSDE